MIEKQKKVIIVEGLSDKKHVDRIIAEEADIVCTNGTLGVEKFDEMLDEYDLDNRDVYILVDADHSGRKLRDQLTYELPHASQLYVSNEYREVASTPKKILATELAEKRIDVNPIFLT